MCKHSYKYIRLQYAGLRPIYIYRLAQRDCVPFYSYTQQHTILAHQTPLRISMFSRCNAWALSVRLFGLSIYIYIFVNRPEVCLRSIEAHTPNGNANDCVAQILLFVCGFTVAWIIIEIMCAPKTLLLHSFRKILRHYSYWGQ